MQHPAGLPRSVSLDDLFRGLPVVFRQAFERLQESQFYPQGALLFSEEHAGAGIFVLHSGSVKVAESVVPGKPQAAVVALPGEILGVAAAVAGEHYESAALTLEPAEVGYVSRRRLLDFLREHSAVAFRLVELLSHALSLTIDQTGSIVLREDTKH